MNTQEMTVNETKKRDHEVRIHIDRHPFDSPNPTTSAALYLLGKIPTGFQLYREVRGDKEDEPIHNDAEREHLTPDEHFYSKEGHHKGFGIIVNAEPHHVDKKRVSFEQIVKLAFPTPSAGQNVLFTVTYYNGRRPTRRVS
jgi:hypothetical protein